MLLGLWLMYGSEAMICKRSRIRGLQKDKLRSLLRNRRMDKVQNVCIRELCRVTEGVNERIDGVIL